MRKEFCKRGHVMAETCRQYATKRACVECAKINGAAYRATHKQQQKKHGRAHYLKNKKQYLAKARAQYVADPARQREVSKRWYLANRDRHRLSALRNLLMTQYGLTLEQYNEIVKAQNGLCAICHCPPTKRRLDVDHDHTDGHVRQLLCERCNKGLGCFKDSLELLEAAVRYMRKHSQLRLAG